VTAPTGNATELTTVSLYRNASIYLALLAWFAPLLMSMVTGRFDETGSDPTATTDASASPIFQVIAIALFVNSVVVARFFKVPLQMVWFAAVPIALVVLWIALSVRWSAYPSLTLRRGARELIELATVILFGLSLNGRDEVLRIVFKVFLLITLLDLASIAIPSRSFTDIGFAGIHGHKNTAGQFFFLAIPIFTIGLLRRSVSGFQLVAAFALVAAGGMCVLSQSKSAIGAMLISGILVGITRILAIRHPFSRIALPLAFTLFVGSIVALILDYGIPETMNLAFGDASLTGRDQIWRYALFNFNNHPLSGVGYGALWQIGPQVETLLRNSGAKWIPNQAHNGYFDVLAQLGAVGFAFLWLFLAASFYRGLRFTSNLEPNRFFGVADYTLYLFWGSLIYNVSETSFLRAGHPLWLMLTFMLAFVAGQLYRARYKSVSLRLVEQDGFRHAAA
jgi:exopolysaccharide production protein ExoQ